jgi:hypothetical protein
MLSCDTSQPLTFDANVTYLEPDILQSWRRQIRHEPGPLNEVLYGGSSPTSSFEFASSLTPSNMGLHHLLLPEVLQLQEQSKLVLVLATTSHLLPYLQGRCSPRYSSKSPFFNPTLRLQLATTDIMEKRHVFTRLGQNYFEF